MKKVISLALCIAIMCPMCLPIHAAETNTGEFDDKLNSCSGSVNNAVPPKGIELAEGERWVPVENGIMPHGMTIEVPNGYTLLGRVEGELEYTFEVQGRDFIEAIAFYFAGKGLSKVEKMIETAKNAEAAQVFKGLKALYYVWTLGEMWHDYRIAQSTCKGPYYKYICSKNDPGIFDYYYYCEYEFRVSDTLNLGTTQLPADIDVYRRVTYEWERI